LENILNAQAIKTVSRLIDRVNAWINDTPDEHDYEVANHTG
jgi:hypothetical protein